MFNFRDANNYSSMYSKRLIAFITPGVITGSVIAGLNVANIKRSPEYREPMVLTDCIRFGLFIGMKGFIYGTFYPIGIFSIIVDSCSKRYFDRHFIPFSQYHTRKINERID